MLRSAPLHENDAALSHAACVLNKSLLLCAIRVVSMKEYTTQHHASCAFVCAGYSGGHVENVSEISIDVI